MSDDGLPVGETAARLGLTVRTLHHWDEIGVASPAERSRAGYRLYTDADVERLRRIVVYRELGLDLDAIRAILDESAGGVADQLRVQRAQLAQRITQLHDLDDDLARMIKAQERGILLSDDEQREIFGPDWNTDWPAQARDAYGQSAQWQQYAERAAARSAGDWATVTEAMVAFEAELGAAVDDGATPRGCRVEQPRRATPHPVVAVLPDHPADAGVPRADVRRRPAVLGALRRRAAGACRMAEPGHR